MEICVLHFAYSLSPQLFASVWRVELGFAEYKASHKIPCYCVEHRAAMQMC